MSDLEKESEDSREVWLRKHAEETRFGTDFIEFRKYPLFPSSVCQNPEVKASQIREIHIEGAPPGIVLDNEILFVMAPLKDQLREFATRNAIPIRSRYDIWAAILEPFLDTEFDEDHQRRTLEQLKVNGVPEREVLAIRKKVGKTMLCVNFFLWEWIYFGLYDVLIFMQPKILGRGRYRQFYWEAMEIALRPFREEGAGGTITGQ